MKIGADGYLQAINPEWGFFGVAPGTSRKTNPNVMDALKSNTIFTNTGVTAENEPWWEGIGGEPPAGLITWRGEGGEPPEGGAGAPECRGTGAAAPTPNNSPKWGAAGGRPVLGVFFLGQAAARAPP